MCCLSSQKRINYHSISVEVSYPVSKAFLFAKVVGLFLEKFRKHKIEQKGEIEPIWIWNIDHFEYRNSEFNVEGNNV